MAILSFNTGTTGLVGQTVNPRRCTMVTSDSLAAITTAGYLNSTNNDAGNPILPTDLFDVLYSFNAATNVGTYGKFQVSYSLSTGWLLTEVVNAGSVILPVVSGDLAVFSGTAGVIADSGVLATNVVLKNAVNVMAAGSDIVLAKGTGTEVTNAVTINQQSGVITSAALTTIQYASEIITLTNSFIATTSVVLATIMGGTNTTRGIAISASANAGTSTIILTNLNSAALNGNVIIGFSVF